METFDEAEQLKFLLYNLQGLFEPMYRVRIQKLQETDSEPIGINRLNPETMCKRSCIVYVNEQKAVLIDLDVMRNIYDEKGVDGIRSFFGGIVKMTFEFCSVLATDLGYRTGINDAKRRLQTKAADEFVAGNDMKAMSLREAANLL